MVFDINDVVGCRFLSQKGSLMNYSKYEIESSDKISSFLVKKWNKLKNNHHQPPFCVI